MFLCRRPRAWTLVLALLLLETACGGGSSPPATTHRSSTGPQRYVSSVCGAVLEWKTVIEVRAASLIEQEPTLPSATAYLKGVLEDTDQMLAHVRAIGAPEAPNGSSLQRDVVHGLADAKSALLGVQAEVKRLLAQGMAGLVREVELPILSTVEAVESELRNPSTVEISQATVSDADCHRLFRRKAPVGIGA
jgi:hypothetical protein